MYGNTLILHLRKTRETKYAAKVMTIIFFNHKVVIYEHTVPPKTTVIDKYYITALKTLG